MRMRMYQEVGNLKGQDPHTPAWPGSLGEPWRGSDDGSERRGRTPPQVSAACKIPETFAEL